MQQQYRTGAARALLPPLHDGQKRLEDDGLDQVVVKARLTRAAPGLLLPVAGDGDDGCILAAGLLPQPGRDLVTVHPGKADVQDHDLRRVLPARDEGMWAVMGDPDGVARE